MKLLAVESSAVSAGAVIIEDGKILAESYLNVGLTHSETLLPMVEQVLNLTGLSAAEMDCFAVAQGPGSFTGIRIGVATVKGLAFPRNTPCVGVSALEAMAYQLSGFDCYASCVMDARRSQVYHALFRIRDGIVERISPDEAVSIDSLRQEIKKFNEIPYIFIGDGAALCYNTLEEYKGIVRLAPSHLMFQRAAGVAMAAEAAAARGEQVEPGELVPTYLRLAQAQRELKLKKEKEKEA